MEGTDNLPGWRGSPLHALLPLPTCQPCWKLHLGCPIAALPYELKQERSLLFETTIPCSCSS